MEMIQERKREQGQSRVHWKYDNYLVACCVGYGMVSLADMAVCGYAPLQWRHGQGTVWGGEDTEKPVAQIAWGIEECPEKARWDTENTDMSHKILVSEDGMACQNRCSVCRILVILLLALPAGDWGNFKSMICENNSNNVQLKQSPDAKWPLIWS